MACDGGTSVSFWSFSSIKVTLVLVLATLICETCICTVPQATHINALNAGEVAEEIGNQSEERGILIPSLAEAPDDNIEEDFKAYKRHLGAVAALSKSRSFSGSKSFIPPSKKHLGSIAAQSLARNDGRKLELQLPGKMEMFKRHVGSLRALSGLKSKPLIRSLKESTDQINSPAGVLEQETPSMIYNTLGAHDYDDIMNPANYAIEPQETQMSPNFPLTNVNEQDVLNGLQHMALLQPEASVKEEFYDNEAINPLNDDEGKFVSKRFLGPLARGGWFPRHFRGVISENAFGKRHIGSLARLGWMPNAKANSRLGLITEDDRGERDIGLKRNDMSPRRRMLYHFAAPSLWASPRGK